MRTLLALARELALVVALASALAAALSLAHPPAAGALALLCLAGVIFGVRVARVLGYLRPTQSRHSGARQHGAHLGA